MNTPSKLQHLIKVHLLLLSLLCLTATCKSNEIQQSVSQLIKQIDEDMNATQTAIVTISEDRLILDAGKESGFYPGMTFIVYSPGEPLKDPKSQSVLGYLPEKMATIRLSRVFELFSVAYIEEGKLENLAPGMPVFSKGRHLKKAVVSIVPLQQDLESFSSMYQHIFTYSLSRMGLYDIIETAQSYQQKAESGTQGESTLRIRLAISADSRAITIVGGLYQAGSDKLQRLLYSHIRRDSVVDNVIEQAATMIKPTAIPRVFRETMGRELQKNTVGIDLISSPENDMRYLLIVFEDELRMVNLPDFTERGVIDLETRSCEFSDGTDIQWTFCHFVHKENIYLFLRLSSMSHGLAVKWQDNSFTKLGYFRDFPLCVEKNGAEDFFLYTVPYDKYKRVFQGTFNRYHIDSALLASFAAKSQNPSISAEKADCFPPETSPTRASEFFGGDFIGLVPRYLSSGLSRPVAFLTPLYEVKTSTTYDDSELIQPLWAGMSSFFYTTPSPGAHFFFRTGLSPFGKSDSFSLFQLTAEEDYGIIGSYDVPDGAIVDAVPFQEQEARRARFIMLLFGESGYRLSVVE